MLLDIVWSDMKAGLSEEDTGNELRVSHTLDF